MLKKVAFTLAEVLITLGIIGVVAAMTIPTLMSKIQEHELYTAYMRVFSILNQAYLHAEEEYGDFSGWEDIDADNYNKLRPFLKVALECPVGESNAKCRSYTGYYKDFTGADMKNGDISNIVGQFPALRLMSGEFIVFIRNGHGTHFMVDLNNDKKPNQIGVDVHLFSIKKPSTSSQYKVYPGAAWRFSVYDEYGACQRDTANSVAWWPGNGCGYWVLKHRNMKYLHMTDEQIKQNW